MSLGQHAVQELEDGEAYAALQSELLTDGGRQLPVLSERLQRAAKAHAKPEADHGSYAAVCVATPFHTLPLAELETPAHPQ